VERSIQDLEDEKKELKDERKAATDPEEKKSLRQSIEKKNEAITATRNNLNALLAEEARLIAAGAPSSPPPLPPSPLPPLAFSTPLSSSQVRATRRPRPLRRPGRTRCRAILTVSPMLFFLRHQHPNQPLTLPAPFAPKRRSGRWRRRRCGGGERGDGRGGGRRTLPEGPGHSSRHPLGTQGGRGCVSRQQQSR